MKESNETLMIQFEILISALKVHGYNHGDITIITQNSWTKKRNSISTESQQVLTLLATKAKEALDVYL